MKEEKKKFAEILEDLFASGDKEAIFFLAVDCSTKMKDEEDKNGPEHSKCLYFIQSLEESEINDEEFTQNIKELLTEDVE